MPNGAFFQEEQIGSPDIRETAEQLYKIRLGQTAFLLLKDRGSRRNVSPNLRRLLNNYLEENEKHFAFSFLRVTNVQNRVGLHHQVLMERVRDAKEAAGRLVTNHLGSMLRAARAVFSHYKRPDISDLVQIGNIALMETVSLADEKKPEKFEIFARRVAIFDMLDAAKKEMRQSRRLCSLNYELSKNNYQELIAESVENQVELKIVKNVLINSVNNLPINNRQVITMSFGLESTQHKGPTEISSILKIPVGTVKSRRRTGLEKIRNESGSLLTP